MAKVVILGAGISGHTAALFARRWLPKAHSVVVVSPKENYNWIPSNIWVGVGRMSRRQVEFPLKPIYDKMNIDFVQARAESIHPEGDSGSDQPFLMAERTDSSPGEKVKIEYDYLINATGPKLNFSATPGLGPAQHSVSVCTQDHAEAAADRLKACIEKMKHGEKQTLVIGVGHGTCTCEGAAFEYVFNVEFELRRNGVRDQARLVFLTNESDLGDFGVGGLHIPRGGYVVPSKIFAESLFAERDVEWITGAHVERVDARKLSYELLDGSKGELAFDFAMLLPPFTGVGITAQGKSGNDLTQELFAPNGFMKVDALYGVSDYGKWKASDWPKSYQSPKYPNIYAVGIAFAPPHPISMPRKSPSGTMITPAPPRTGMPSAMMGKMVARNIVDEIRGKKAERKTGSMAKMGAACVASAGANMISGSAASMTMYPIVPDFDRYPEYGRDLKLTFGDIGTAGHWIKRILHHLFLYKAKAKPFWWMIPE